MMKSSIKNGISCAALLKMIPSDLIKNLEEETRVNYQVKKLSGGVVLKLLLLTLLDSRKASLRIMEQIYRSDKFQIFASPSCKKIKHSGLASRISSMNYVFFEKIFQNLNKQFSSLKTQSKFNLVIYDSTLVSLSAKLLNSSLKSGGGKQKQIKFTLGFDGRLPVSVKVFKKPSYASEDIALKEAIFSFKKDPNTIIIFDRGLQKRETFCRFNQEKIPFITRLNNNSNYQLVKNFKNIKGRKSETLKFKQDLIVRLRNGNMKWTKETFRIIIAESLKTGEELRFITNMTNLSAREITDLYKERWEIEVFFKFLKQELNFSHLISRSENGIKVILYATLILALLLLVFKDKNQINSYKIAKFKFADEIDMEIVKEIVILCGGDLTKYFGRKTLIPGES